MSDVIPIVAEPAAPAAAGEMVSLDAGGGEFVWMYEAQKKIYPRAVRGWFANWRWAFVGLTQIVFYGLPWLTWGERQAVLFDLALRRFYIGGLVLYPQDFIYLTALLVISAYALFFFTAVAGRVWCGYACPQTVYTEMFLWVENVVEGDRIQRMKLDAGPWTARKIVRKTTKQAIWIALGLWTGFTFVGYFTPIHALWGEAFTLTFGPWEWFWVLFYGFATYGNAGYMREQVCKYMCPYARFQSAMFDKDTLTVSYDATRGEPRGSRPKRIVHAELATQGKGDCIDCGLCVQVCPTGIDIRRGLQYECIGCAACIDVCNDVMDKMSYPRGLIRYATQNALRERWTKARMWGRLLRPRVLIYGAILVAITAAFVASLALRTPLRVDVVRDRGSLARIVERGAIENTYRLQVMNATEATQRLRIGVSGIDGVALEGEQLSQALPGATDVEVGPAQSRWVPVNVRVPAGVAQRLGGGAHPLVFEITSITRDDVKVVERSTFVVPR